MNKRKAGGLSLAVIGIIFLVYNLLVFFIFKPSTPVFWISYGFMIVAFATQILSLFLSAKTLDVQTVFFGIPLVQFSIFYFFAELFASIVFMIFQEHLGYKIPIAIQVVLLAIFAIIAIIAVSARDTTREIKDNIQNSSANFKMIAVDVQMIAEGVKDPELKKKIERVSENIKYSDPMTNEAVADVEMRIHQAINELRVCCEDNNKAAAMDCCSRLDRMVLERSQKLRLLK